MRMHLKFLAGGIVVLSASSGAYAQKIDYGTFEEIYGEPVTTSATGKPQRVSEVPAAMRIVTAEEIRRSGARDIPDVLRLLPGVEVQQKSAFQFELSIRGYNQITNPRVLVLVNGRQVFLGSFNFTAWNTIPVQVEQIRQIEVVKGPNTALFGFNAATGVINIVTFDPVYDDLNTVSVGGGFPGDFYGVASSNFKIGKDGGLNLSAAYEEREAFDSAADLALFTGGESRNTQDKTSVSADLSLKLSESVTWSADAAFNESTVNFIGPDFSLGFANFQTYSVRSSLAYSAGDTGDFTFTAYRNWEDDFISAPNLLIDNTVTVLNLQYLGKPSAALTVRGLVEYRSDITRTENLVAPGISNNNRLEREIFSASAMLDYQFSPDLTLNISGRLDRISFDKSGFDVEDEFPGSGFANADFTRTDEEFSFNAGLTYQLSENDRLRFTAARGLSIPSGVDLGFTGTAPIPVGPDTFLPLITAAVPGLQTNATTNFEIGYTRNIAGINGAFEAAVFYQEQSQLRSFLSGVVPVPNFPGVLASEITNIGDSSMIGFELTLDGKFNDTVYWEVNYTFLDIDDDFTDPDRFFVNFEESVANHQISANIGAELGKFSFDIRGYYISDTRQLGGDFPFIGLQDIDGFFRADANLRYMFNDQLEFNISAQNIFDNDLIESPGVVIEQQVTAGLRLRF